MAKALEVVDDQELYREVALTSDATRLVDLGAYEPEENNSALGLCSEGSVPSTR